MKNLIAIISLLFVTNSAFAQVVACKGFTDQSKEIAVSLDLNVNKKKGSIRYISENSAVTQGLNLTEVYYSDPKTLRFTDLQGSSYLDFLIKDGQAVSNSFTHGSYFKNTKLDCKIAGKIPNAPSCGFDTNEQLIDILRHGRGYQTLQEVKFQTACGTDVNYTDTFGCTPLLYVIDPSCGNNPPVFGQSISGLAQIIDYLVSEGAIVDVVDQKKNETALLKVARLGIKNTYSSFLAADANFDFQDSSGMTPLMWAVMNGDDWSVKDILDGRPDRRIKNNKGFTAYDLANFWQKNSVVDLVRIPDVTIEVRGQADGSCSPLNIEAGEGQLLELVLFANDRMFKLDSALLELDLMADRNSKDTQIIKLENAGEFEFTCGIHHGSQISQGKIIVK